MLSPSLQCVLIGSLSVGLISAFPNTSLGVGLQPDNSDVIRVSTLANPFKDSVDNVWEARSGFTSGYFSKAAKNGHTDIIGTADDALYRSQAVGVRSWQRSVPSGSYDVTIKMRESWWDAARKRVFDVLAENRPAATGIDIFGSVGKYHAHDETFRVEVTDGRLDLTFKARQDLPTVSAIEVRRVPDVAAKRTITSIAPSQATGQLASSDRGQYLWYPEEHNLPVPETHSATDSYARFPWAELEPRPGRYEFAAIDDQLAKARARGGTFSFRVMPVCAWCGAPASLPSDLADSPRSWSATLDDGEVLRIPDWNDAAYLRRWGSLMKALGERYDKDPAFGYIDSGGYGNWGEGHNWPYEGMYPRPSGQRSATVESATSIVDSVIRYFPTSYVLHSPYQLRNDSEQRYDPEASWASLRAALTAAPRVGIRNDCLGGGSVQAFALELLNDAQRRAVSEGLPVIDRPLDRWQIAPFVTEWCDSINPSGNDGTFAQGAQQVNDLHVSLLSNGNFKGTLTEYSASEQSAFLQANRLAGYRFSLPKVTVSSAATSGKSVIEAQWVNDGVAPTYQNWIVEYSLRDDKGLPVRSVRSRLALKTLLGGEPPVDDSVSIETAELPGGAYSLHVRAIDEEGYRPALGIAVGNRLSDGSYQLGQVRLGTR